MTEKKQILKRKRRKIDQERSRQNRRSWQQAKGNYDYTRGRGEKEVRKHDITKRRNAKTRENKRQQKKDSQSMKTKIRTPLFKADHPVCASAYVHARIQVAYAHLARIFFPIFETLANVISTHHTTHHTTQGLHACRHSSLEGPHTTTQHWSRHKHHHGSAPPRRRHRPSPSPTNSSAGAPVLARPRPPQDCLLLPNRFSTRRNRLGSRLHVSEVSRALFESYGGSLTRVDVRYVEGSTADRLCALLQRHKKNVEVYVYKEESMQAFCLAIAQGCCQGVECVELLYWEETRPESVSALIGALEIDGALPMLRRLSVNLYRPPGAILQLARALARGTPPLLTDLTIEYCETNDLEALADMMEARARLPGCQRLRDFKTKGNGRDCAGDADPVGARPAAIGEASSTSDMGKRVGAEFLRDKSAFPGGL